ncbi:hypothetical protein B0H14DRAFT_2584776 [Mycena olivaceomarginata]|nr:hypothetical protein B0H14DRAFT_2584776 [Mycena olivaceomarginata]
MSLVIIQWDFWSDPAIARVFTGPTTTELQLNSMEFMADNGSAVASLSRTEQATHTRGVVAVQGYRMKCLDTLFGEGVLLAKYLASATCRSRGSTRISWGEINIWRTWCIQPKRLRAAGNSQGNTLLFDLVLLQVSGNCFTTVRRQTPGVPHKVHDLDGHTLKFIPMVTKAVAPGGRGYSSSSTASADDAPQARRLTPNTHTKW